MLELIMAAMLQKLLIGDTVEPQVTAREKALSKQPLFIQISFLSMVFFLITNNDTYIDSNIDID